MPSTRHLVYKITRFLMLFANPKSLRTLVDLGFFCCCIPLTGKMLAYIELAFPYEQIVI